MNEKDNSDLRIKLLKISDSIQGLSIEYRQKGLKQEHACLLNNLQIKVGELIGRLWDDK